MGCHPASEADRKLLIRWYIEPPFQAELNLDTFVGREKYIDELKNALLPNNQTAVCVLDGMGGVGKTVLAIQIAHLLRDRFSDGVLFANLAKSDTISILKSFISAYNVAVNRDADIYSLSDQLRKLLEPKRALIILDDAEDNNQVKSLLPSTNSCVVLITTRNRGLAHSIDNQVRQFHIKPFDKNQGESIALFTKRLGKEKVHDSDNHNSLTEIADLLGHLPIAIDMTASHLLREAALAISEFLMIATDEINRLNLNDPGQKDLNVRAIFNISYKQLLSEESSFFSSLGVFGANDFDVDAAAYINDNTPIEAKMILGELVNLSLVQFNSRSQRYSLHSLLCDFAREKIKELTTADVLYGRMAEHYKTILHKTNTLHLEGSDSQKEGLFLYDLEWPNIKAGQKWAVNHADSHDKALELCSEYPDVGTNILSLRLNAEERVEWRKVALSAARKMNSRELEGKHLAGLGVAYGNLSNYRRAIELNRKALNIFRETGFRQGEAKALGNLAYEHYALGKLQISIQLSEECLAIHQEIGNYRDIGHTLNNLGIYYEKTGDFSRALELYEQARIIYREQGMRHAESSAVGNIGSKHYQSGNYRLALKYFKQQLEIARETGHRISEANALRDIGTTQRSMGKPELALKKLNEALDIYDEIGNLSAKSIALESIGDTYLVLGQPQTSIMFCDLSLKIAREIGDRDNEAYALKTKSLALIKLDQQEMGNTHLKAALQIFEQLRHPEAAKVKKILESIDD